MYTRCRKRNEREGEREAWRSSIDWSVAPWNVAAILGVYEPRYIRFSLRHFLSRLSLALSFFPSLILSLSPLFVSRLPSLRFYPVVKRRRVTWTQERSIRGSPTRDLVSLVLSHSLSLSYSLFLSLIFSVLFSVSVSFFFSISHGSISIRFASLCDIVVNL